jgi:hypothetical protein
MGELILSKRTCNLMFLNAFDNCQPLTLCAIVRIKDNGSSVQCLLRSTSSLHSINLTEMLLDSQIIFSVLYKIVCNL